MSLKVAGLFAGIGGIEEGLRRSGHHSELLCEVEPAAQAVLRRHFPTVELTADVRVLAHLPRVDLVAAGFPCQDLSQAGMKAGIDGRQSGLVQEVFRLLGPKATRPEWLLLENVSYMLRLERGQAMNYLVTELEGLGYTWAYRVVDARAFGVPQRRQRVILLASRNGDPGSVLFADDAPNSRFDDSTATVDQDAAYGFYWTEGLRGLGWTRDATPTVKGGSSLGIPSPPAVWVPRTSTLGTPEIEDGERLQGFDADWTLPATEAGFRPGARWKLVGNAVCVDMAAWVGRRLSQPGPVVAEATAMRSGDRWPAAAQGGRGARARVDASTTPLAEPFDLLKFLALPLRPLSVKAASGFLSRSRRSSLRPPLRFLADLEEHCRSD